MLVTIDSLKNHQEKVAIVGLGYVGLPLAVALAKHFSVIGVDIKESRITDLKSGLDTTGELSAEALKAVRIEYASDPQKLREAKVFILALPTPVDEGNLPDLSLVEKATASSVALLSFPVFRASTYLLNKSKKFLRASANASASTSGFSFCALNKLMIVRITPVFLPPERTLVTSATAASLALESMSIEAKFIDFKRLTTSIAAVICCLSKASRMSKSALSQRDSMRAAFFLTINFCFSA
jgi:hypothetical protein